MAFAKRLILDQPPETLAPAGGLLVALVGAPADGEVPTWNGGAGQFEPAAPAGGAAGGVVGASFDNAGAVLTLTGTTAVRAAARSSGTIGRVAVVTAGGAGSATVVVKKCSAADFLSDPANLADITGGHDVAVSSAYGLDDSTLTGWTLDVTAGDVFQFALSAVSVFTQLTITVEYA